MGNSEQDQHGEPGSARPRSIWADMVISGAGEEEPDPEPDSAEPDSAEPGALSWPSSGLPPSFGQRSAEDERPSPAERPSSSEWRSAAEWPSATEPWWADAEPGQDAASQRPAEPGFAHGGRPLGSLPPDGLEGPGSPDEPGSPGHGPPAPEPPEPGHYEQEWLSQEPFELESLEQEPHGLEPQDRDVGQGPAPSSPPWEDAPDPANPEAGGSAAPAYGPWETYETAEGYEWTGGYGVVPPPEAVGPYGGEPAAGGQASYGVVGLPPPRGSPWAPGPPEGSHGAYGPPGAGGSPGPQASHAGYGTVAPDGEAPPQFQEQPGYEQRQVIGQPQDLQERARWQAESADSLTADLLLPGRHAAPPSGWRRTLYQITGGMVRAPQSAADRRRKDLVVRVRTPVAGGHHRVAVLSLKGGVGKTTTTVGLGSTLASLRGDRIIAVDANPDRGTLCDKVRLETAATVRDLLNEEDQIRRYADVRAYTTQAPSGLEVLASDRDPTVSVAFSAEDYEDVARVLEHYYSVCVTDCGTGLLHSAMAGVLHLADQIVLVSSPSVDGARSASATLDWLAAHQYGDLVRGAVVVLSAIRPRSKSAVDLARLEQHFATRCRAVVRIPYDAHLEEGAEVDLDQLGRATADSYLVLAAEVGDGFARTRH